jgi:hypothetical protein
LQGDLDELVSVMKHDPGCSMKTLHELYESRLCKGIGKEFSGEQRDKEWKKIYDVG